MLGVDDLWRIERVGAVALSPDGTRAVCGLTRYSMDDNQGASSLWLLSTTGEAPRPLTHCGDKDGQPAWSPDGRHIAFVARREQEGRKDNTPQIYVIASDGGEARRVSDFACGVEAFKWFPDGRRIAFVSWVWPDARGTKAQARRYKAFSERKESAYLTSEAQYRHWDHKLPMGRVPHLHVLDLDSGRVRDLFEGSDFELPRSEPNADCFDIRADGQRIAFVFDPQKEKQNDHCHALAELNLRQGQFRDLMRDDAWDAQAPRYSPDGRQVAFLASHQGLRHTMPAHLALADAASARARWQVCSADWDHDVQAPLRWAPDARSVYFPAEDRARRHLYRFDFDQRQATVVAPGGWVHAFDVAADAVLTAADAMNHPVRVTVRLGDAAAQRIETFNDELLRDIRMGEHEEVAVTGALGEPVHAWIVYPPGFDRKSRHRYPLLQAIHGGPHTASGDTFHYRWNNQVFAAQGYVVVCVNYHGSSSFGHAFLDSITHRWGELELQDIEAATDWFLTKPWADRKRVYATGGSYGGYMVAWMNAHVPAGRYNAYVCHAGCFDWTAMSANDAYAWHARELGAWYWEDMARVHAQSPHAYAAGMATPTLVVHGALDYRVPDQQGLAYYNTLKILGVDARLMWFPDENHWVLKPRNSRLWYREFFDWLERHAKRASTVPKRRPLP